MIRADEETTLQTAINDTRPAILSPGAVQQLRLLGRIAGRGEQLAGYG